MLTLWAQCRLIRKVLSCIILNNVCNDVTLRQGALIVVSDNFFSKLCNTSRGRKPQFCDAKRSRVYNW